MIPCMNLMKMDPVHDEDIDDCLQWRHYVGVGSGARNNLGPHKVMTYVGGSGGFSARNVLNLGSLKWHFLHFESTFE